MQKTEPDDTINNGSLFNNEAFNKALALTEPPLALFQKTLQQANIHFKKQFLDGVPASELVLQRAKFIDQLLIEAWHRFIGKDETNIALIAVGGYGRAELHPCSDIDLLILLRNDNHSDYQQQIEQLLALLWDIGLEIGHSVRSVNECIQEAERDITIATNLMESRLLTGSEDIYLELNERSSRDHIWTDRQFFEAKIQEQQQRHHKYNDTAYNLEPNIKEGPGGLRDIQMIGWVAKRHFNATTLKDLIHHDFLTQKEYNSLIKGQNFLWQIRFGLHILTGRKEERLFFDYQRILAKQLSYRDDDKHLGVEKFMKDYYRTITKLSRLNEMLLQLFQEAILYANSPAEIVPINKRFRSYNGYIEVTDNNIFRKYPFALLEIFLLLEQHPEFKGVRASTIRLIRDHRHLIDDDFRNDLRCTSLFIEILKQPKGVTHELRRMNLYGILAAYIPAFEKIVGQMQYDLFHVYTVDDHTLMVLRNLRRFTVKEFSHEFPKCSEISQRIPKPEILYLGALFHDIAKGRGGDHSELGMHDAISFCQKHGLSQYDTDMVAWLVKSHLIMSATAQRKDISDPEVIATFAKLVGDQRHLDYLYLLTVADIRGTDPEKWNSWKDSLLNELYRVTQRALHSDTSEPPDLSGSIKLIQNEALALLDKHNISRDVIAILWEQLNDDYFMRHSADEIAWHTLAIIQCSESDLPMVLVREQTQRGGTEIFVYAHDKDHLFAVSTMTLAQLGLDIVDARIITANNGFTLDTYIVLDESGETIHDTHRIKEIVSRLKQHLKQDKTGPIHVSRRPPRQLKHFPIKTQVNFSTDNKHNHSIMELTTTDRPGVLSSVGQAFIKCHVRVQNAKIAAFGARVEDVFFITNKDNQPLATEEEQQCLRKAIIDALDNSENNK